jgi:UDP-N-acetylmuramate: L-alanyl-gamma-D-glutamyl-meso-diaminopimelate ligase
MATFQSVRKRMEIKGEADGVLVVEDFAHHPTAIRMTLDATRTRWPGRKIWAAVEPRSNTMRRKIFQHVLPEALAIADAIVIGPVSRAQLLEEGDRLSPESIAQSLVELGKPARAFNSSDAIVEFLAAEARPGDMVMVMSNGSFDGLSGKLLEKFKSLEGARK